MKVNLNQNQVDFIKKITKNTECQELTTSFVPNKEIEIDDDVAEELREKFADIEIYKLQSETKDEEYKIASELVDLFCN